MALFSNHALEKNWFYAGEVVARQLHEKAPENARARKLYLSARKSSDEHQTSDTLARLELLHAAQWAHARGFLYTTRILLKELQRTNPQNQNISKLIAKLEKDLRKEKRMKANQQNRKDKLPTKKKPAPPANQDSASSKQFKRKYNRAAAQNSNDKIQAPPPRSDNENHKSSPTSDRRQATDQNEQSPQQGTEQNASSISAPPPPQAAHGTLQSMPLHQRQAYTKRNSHQRPPKEKASEPKNSTFNPGAGSHRSARLMNRLAKQIREYEPYDGPYIITKLKNSHLERAEEDILEEWVRDVQIDRVIENGQKSLLKIGNKAYGIGEPIKPEYYLYWHGLNTEKNKLIFVDRRGQIYIKSY